MERHAASPPDGGHEVRRLAPAVHPGKASAPTGARRLWGMAPIPDAPDWARRYTQLSHLPQRVRDLSAALTQGRPTPYDKAAAVEQFLRQVPAARE